MSRPTGGYVGFNRVPAGADINSAAVGVWTLREAEALKRAGTWPNSFIDPTSQSGLQLWLDASDANTLYDATTGGSLVAADGGVARWEDKSGNARHFTQSTAGSRPTRKTSQQNGRDTLLFDGSGDFLNGSDFMDANTGGLTAFVVYKRNATGAIHELLYKMDTLGRGWFMRHDSNDKLQGYLDLGGNSSQRSTDQTVSASSYIVAAWQFTAGAFKSLLFHRNGMAVAMAAATDPNGSGAQTPPNNSSIVRIGVQEYLGVFYYYANVNIAEIIIYDSALSDAARAAVESYLMSKWGIS